MGYGKKAKKLIEAGGAVPFRRPWQKRKTINCKQIRSFFGILEHGKNHVKPRFLFRISRHVKHCSICKKIGGVLKF